MIPSLLLVTVVHSIFGFAGIGTADLSPHEFPLDTATVVIIALVTPMVETLFLAFAIGSLGLLSFPAKHVAVASALGWGICHGALAPLWFFGAVWSFFVFSTAYITWRPVSFWHAFFGAAIPHILVNSSVLAMLLSVELLTASRAHEA